MTRNVLVVGHSDADGHVIAEQTRRNLALIPGFEVDVVVDPKRTYGHRSWCHLGDLVEVDRADLVVFVDLMFSPATFVPEVRSLQSFAKARPDKTFFVVDHHPLPLARLAAAPNIRSVYRPDVFECVIGPKSGMMVLAAIDEKQGHTIAPFRTQHHDILTKGLKRAAAVGSELPGSNLMALLRADRWDLIYELGIEDSSAHRMVRGRRVANEAQSEALMRAYEAVRGLLEGNVNEKPPHSGNSGGEGLPMPYDVTLERYVFSDEPKRYLNEPVQTRDLETLVTLLEVAAISLTKAPDTTFTREELIAEARYLGGEGISIDEDDVRVVLQKASFVSWTAGELRLR